MELVSIIMATYNTEIKILEESINSLLNQSYKHFEIIIIDDCSSNKSYEYLNEIKDSRIKVIKNNQNLGLANCLNKALALSKGKFIMRMDADDISDEKRIEKQVNYLFKNPDIDIVGSFAKNFGENNNLNITPLFKKDEIKIQLFTNATLIHPTVMFRKSFIDKHQIIYNNEYLCAQDFELWTRCDKLTNIAIIPEVLLFYRVHNKQISCSKSELQKNYAKKIIIRQLEKFGIPFSEKDLYIQYMIAGIVDFDIKHLGDIKQWIEKLHSYNLKQQTYNPKLFKNILKVKVLNLYLKNCEKKSKIFNDIFLNKNGMYFVNYYCIKNLISRLILKIKLNKF